MSAAVASKLVIASLVGLMLGCGTPHKQPAPATPTVATDLVQLGTLLDLKVYRPLRVRYQYVVHDNSGAGDRLSIPGPSDQALGAVLEFDHATFLRLQSLAPTRRVGAGEYEFEWLDAAVRAQLKAMGDSVDQYPLTPFQAKSGCCGGYILLPDKLLLTSSTN